MQQRGPVGVVRARLRRDPLQERHLSVDIVAVGIDPPPERGPDQLVRQLGQESLG